MEIERFICVGLRNRCVSGCRFDPFPDPRVLFYLWSVGFAHTVVVWLDWYPTGSCSLADKCTVFPLILSQPAPIARINTAFFGIHWAKGNHILDEEFAFCTRFTRHP